jgi:hypothetical protein
LVQLRLQTKAYDTEDVVIGAVVRPLARPEAVVVGRYTSNGQLDIVGSSSALTPRQRPSWPPY